MTIIRETLESDAYAPIRRGVFTDSRISFQAKGVLGHLMTIPHGGETHISRIADSGTESTAQVVEIIRELVEAGYISYEDGDMLVTDTPEPVGSLFPGP